MYSLDSSTNCTLYARRPLDDVGGLVNPEASLFQPGLSWRASTLRQMALSGVPARYNKSFGLIRQYRPTFATAHGGIQCDCGGGFPTLPDIFLFRLNYNSFI